jgi:uncharacterized membrane protein YgdD (TMEM256/DUF423 family)
MYRLAILLGAGNAALAIILGAFAAHALKNTLTEKMLNVFNTAVDYHLYHALALMVVGILIHQQDPANKPNRALRTSIYLMVTGLIVFCGSLYALSITGITKFGMITPIGGIAFIAAWLFVFAAFINKTFTG